MIGKVGLVTLGIIFFFIALLITGAFQGCAPNETFEEYMDPDGEYCDNDNPCDQIPFDQCSDGNVLEYTGEVACVDNTCVYSYEITECGMDCITVENDHDYCENCDPSTCTDVPFDECKVFPEEPETTYIIFYKLPAWCEDGFCQYNYNGNQCENCIVVEDGDDYCVY